MRVLLPAALLCMSCAHVQPRKCAQSPRLEFKAAAIPASFQPDAADFVTLRRTPTVGGPKYVVTLGATGHVTAVGQIDVARSGPLEWTIDPELARRVLYEFAAVDELPHDVNFLWSEKDQDWATLEISLSGRREKSDHYGAGAELTFTPRGQLPRPKLWVGTQSELVTRLELLVDAATEAPRRVVGCVY